MIDSSYRSFYQAVMVNPVLDHPLLKRISPNQATLIGLLFGLLTIPLLVFHLNGLASMSLLLSGYFDTLDGSLARYRNAISPIGSVFDITSDRLVEFSVILGLFLYDPDARALSCLLMLGSVLMIITSFLVVGIFSTNESEKSFHYSLGLMERTEAFVFWFVMILFPTLFFYLCYAFIILVTFTTMVRLYQFSKNHMADK